MKVKITRKDELTQVRECFDWRIALNYSLLLLEDADGSNLIERMCIWKQQTDTI